MLQHCNFLIWDQLRMIDSKPFWRKVEPVFEVKGRHHRIISDPPDEQNKLYSI